jgi:hypothetical protein
MNKFTLSLLFASILTISASAQEKTISSKHGNNLNIGVGGGYYSYRGNPTPFVMLNYEMDVAKNFTLAPFIGFYSYTNTYYWGNKNYPYQYYGYRETAVPLGVKAAFYFDDLLKANNKWDFYVAASLGFVFRTVSWDAGYYGDRNYVQETSPLYVAAHLGTRYHVSQKIGIFLDLSSDFSTFGLSFKL